MADTVNWIVLLLGLSGVVARFRRYGRRRNAGEHTTVSAAELRQELQDDAFAVLTLIVLVVAANLIEDLSRLDDLGVPRSEVGTVLWWITVFMFSTMTWATVVAIRRRTQRRQTLVAPVICALVGAAALIGLLSAHGNAIFHLP